MQSTRGQDDPNNATTPAVSEADALKRINTVGLVVAGVMVLAQVASVVLGVNRSPDYVLPFLKSPFGIGLIVAALSWQAFGVWFATRATSKKSAINRWAFAEFFCIAPAFVIPMVGPALLTIKQALGV